MTRTTLACTIALAMLTLAAPVNAQTGLKEGTPDLKSAGPLAFGPDGVLFLGDSQSAAVFAVATGDTTGNPAQAAPEVNGIDQKVASLLGTTAQEVQIVDLAVNPASGNVYLSVSRGRGPQAVPVIVRVDGKGQLQEVSLEKALFAKAALPNAPGESDVDRRRQSKRQQSITDLVYAEGQVFVAGLSNEEFESTLRSIPYPFSESERGTGVKIYHGAHGRFETESPVRTFTHYKIGDEGYLLAGYTCTPLVKFPVSQLKPGSQLQGVTIAELGNRNRPLDMFVYQKGGKDYILMANSSRGVMKITTDNIGSIEGITSKINDTAGLNYETIKDLEGVVQLDRLNESKAVIITQSESGQQNLQTIDLP